jgi:hypothetical protein
MALEFLRYSPEFEATTREIVRDIEGRTGLQINSFGGLDTKDLKLGPSVVPILCEWLEKPNLATDVRRGLYLKLMTPYVYPFFDSVVSWWMRETDSGSLDVLLQTVAYFVKDKDARRVWDHARTISPPPGYYFLMESLSKCPSVSQEVRDAVVRDLTERPLSCSNVAQISRMRDPRIMDWFRRQGILSEDARIRSLSKKLIDKTIVSIPVELKQVQQCPDRSREVFSTEIDLHKAPALFRKLSKQFGLLIPPAMRKIRTLESLELDRWYRLYPDSTAPVHLELWLRLEDSDVIGIYLGGSGSDARARTSKPN